MLLMAGETGPICVHPPEACYSGQGYEVVGGSRRTVTIDTPAESGLAAKPKFKSARFSKPGLLSPTQPQIFWAWSDDGNWRVPQNTRYEFAGSPILCKLYVTWDAPLPDSRTRSLVEEITPPEEFLQLLAPELFRTVFSQEAAGK